MKKYTDIDVSLINMFHRYSDGRAFPYHLLWAMNNGQAKDALRCADIWHIHNYLIREIKSLRRGKKVLAQFHSLPRLGNWKDLMKYADLNYTIQQPLHEKEYKLPGLPNIIDPDEYFPMRRQRKVKIAFAPTSKAPVGHPSSKGYSEIKTILNKVAQERDIDIAWIEGRDYIQNLKIKRQCHILIDDVVTGNWHRTSLEGACFGCAILNRVQKLPFIFANLDTLEKKLLWLIDKPKTLQDIQERTRLWILKNWHAMDKIKYYVRAYKRLLNAS